jgi:hypothetical protein
MALVIFPLEFNPCRVNTLQKRIGTYFIALHPVRQVCEFSDGKKNQKCADFH